MTSKDKCPNRYIDDNGEKIWDIAIEYGLDYDTYVTPIERDEILRDSRTQLDASWSHKYAGFGGHFNRVSIEAMMQGTIPIARNLGMAGNENGNNDLFTANENYVNIPWNASPEEFADIVSVANNLPIQVAANMQIRNFHLLQCFDRRKICNDYIRFAMGENDVGFYNKTVISELDDKLIKDSNRYMEKFFINL
jgi:hypothetical protein